MKSRLFGAATIAALSFGLQPAMAQAPIKIGFVSTFSGPQAAIGEDMRRSVELAKEHLGGKMGGRPIEIIYEDDQFKPDVGKQRSEKLVQQDKVNFVAGYIWSNVLLASLKTVTDEGDTILISSNAGPSQIAGELCNKNFFSTSWQNDQTPMAMGDYLQGKGVKSLYLMAGNYAAGKDMLAGVKRTFKGQIIGEDLTKWPDQLDFSAELAKIRAAKPDGIFIFYPLRYPELKDDEVMDLVDPEKDIEGLHATNIGYLNKFRKRLDGSDQRCMTPCTARAVVKTIKRGFGDGWLAGKTVLVINDSLRIGRPLNAMVANLKATPIVCHAASNPQHLEQFIKLADVIVSAVPAEGYQIRTDWIKDGAMCFDLSGQGNFDYAALDERKIPYTDTQKNSIGKVTRAMALLNLTYAAGLE